MKVAFLSKSQPPNKGEKKRKRKKTKAYYPFSFKITFMIMYKMAKNGKC